MATDKIKSRIEGAIAHLIFNNPERRNAVSLDMWEAVEETMDAFALDENIRVVIISGTGGKAFVSGADISKFESERSSEEAVAHYNATTARIYTKLHNFAKPVIAKINGYCVGGGVGLATCCDIRICNEGAKFAVPAAKLGLGYAHEGVRRLMDLVGPSYTKDFFFSARMFTAAEAYNMGLVNQVVADDELEQFVLDYANKIAGNAPMTVASIKTIVGELVKDEEKRDIALCESVTKACFDRKSVV